LTDKLEYLQVDFRRASSERITLYYPTSSNSRGEKQEAILNNEGIKDSKEGGEHWKSEFSKAISCNVSYVIGPGHIAYPK
jgi:hypothetical protein